MHLTLSCIWAKQLTGNCSCDLLFFKAADSQICLLVQSLITQLYTLNLGTAGKTKHCQDCIQISQAIREHKAHLGDLLLSWAGSHRSVNTYILLQSTYHAPCYCAVRCPLEFHQNSYQCTPKENNRRHLYLEDFIKLWIRFLFSAVEWDLQFRISW